MNIPPLIHLTAVIPVQVLDNRQRTGEDALTSPEEKNNYANEVGSGALPGLMLDLGL